MGYLHTRRYVIDADNRDDLVAIVRRAYWPEDIEGWEKSLDEMNEHELVEVITRALDSGNATEVCQEFDEWTNETPVRAYFSKYTLEQVAAEGRSKS
jgi:hypothetical protein